MTSLRDKTIAVVGGSSGIGYAVALASLQSLASVVIIASSNQVRVSEAVQRLKFHSLPGEVRGTMLDANNSAAVKAFAEELGIVDHIVWTSGDIPTSSNIESAEQGKAIARLNWLDKVVYVWQSYFSQPYLLFGFGDLMSWRGMQSSRREGLWHLQQVCVFHEWLWSKYSITVTPCDAPIFPVALHGMRPSPGSPLSSSVAAALDGLSKGLAVDLAPVRVNVVNPGLVSSGIYHGQC